MTPASRSVDPGQMASFTVTPNIGYVTHAAVSGDCPPGSWNGEVYTTGAITEGCTVVFTFDGDYPGDCTGTDVELRDGVYWDDIVECTAPGSIIVGPNVGVEGASRIVLTAPEVTIGPVVRVEEGSEFRVDVSPIQVLNER